MEVNHVGAVTFTCPACTRTLTVFVHRGMHVIEVSCDCTIYAIVVSVTVTQLEKDTSDA